MHEFILKSCSTILKWLFLRKYFFVLNVAVCVFFSNAFTRNSLRVKQNVLVNLNLLPNNS